MLLSTPCWEDAVYWVLSTSSQSIHQSRCYAYRARVLRPDSKIYNTHAILKTYCWTYPVVHHRTLHVVLVYMIATICHTQPNSPTRLNYLEVSHHFRHLRYQKVTPYRIAYSVYHTVVSCDVKSHQFQLLWIWRCSLNHIVFQLGIFELTGVFSPIVRILLVI